MERFTNTAARQAFDACHPPILAIDIRPTLPHNIAATAGQGVGGRRESYSAVQSLYLKHRYGTRTRARKTWRDVITRLAFHLPPHIELQFSPSGMGISAHQCSTRRNIVKPAKELISGGSAWNRLRRMPPIVEVDAKEDPLAVRSSDRTRVITARKGTEPSA